MLEGNQSEVRLGTHSERTQPIPSQHITIKTVVPVRAITATCRLTRFGVDVKQSKANSSEHELTIAPEGILPVGRYAFDVQVEVELDSGRKVRPGQIAVIGEIAADIQAAPPVLALGARSLGETVEETLTISSLTGQAFQVIDVKVNGGGLAVEPLQDGAEAHAYHVRQHITGLQSQHGWVSFRVRNEAGREEDIRVGVIYHGLEVPIR